MAERFVGILIILLAGHAATGATIVYGDDWSLPSWVEAKSDYLFFSEEGSPGHLGVTAKLLGFSCARF